MVAATTAAIPATAASADPAWLKRLFTQEFEEDFQRTAQGFTPNHWPNSSGQQARWVLSKGEGVRDSAGVAGGAQRFRVENRPEGADVHLVNPHSFVRGQAYRVQFMARAERTTKVDLFLRRDVRPFTPDASKTIEVTREWKSFTFQGTYTAAVAGSFRIGLQETGVDVFIDRYAVFRVTGSDRIAPIDIPAGMDATEQTTLVHDVDFEGEYTHGRYARGWQPNDPSNRADAFEAGPETRAGYFVDGTTSQRFKRETYVADNKVLESRAELYYSFTCQPKKKYRVTAHLRADQGQTEVPAQFGVRRAPEPYTFLTVRNLKLGGSWQPVEMDVVCVQRAGTGIQLRLTVGQVDKNIYIDDLTVSEVHDNPAHPVGTGVVSDNLFGIHSPLMHNPNWRWPALGQHVVRLWDTNTAWRFLEKDQDVWPWDDGQYGKRLDQTFMKKLIQTRNTLDPKLKIVYTMGETPNWASSKPDTPNFAAAPPKNDEDWKDYVRTVARRYKGEIDVYELWNEPDAGPRADGRSFYSGTPERMAQLARLARDVLDREDEEAILVSPGITTGGVSWLDRFLAAGGAEAVHGVGFHWYFGTNPENVGYIDNIRDVMRRHGIEHKKLWNTEGSSSNCVGGVGPCLNDKVAVCLKDGACDAAFCAAEPGNCREVNAVERRSAVARALLLMAGRGVENFNFYTLEGSHDAKLLESAATSDYTTPSEEGRGYSAAADWLRGGKVLQSYIIRDDIYVLRIQQGAQQHSVLWTTGEGVRVRLPQQWNAGQATTLAGTRVDISADRELDLGLEPVKIAS
ncbi:hypothetical protein BG844_28660 [Couchioplanes caeruleus subsp. caeruleus]|uniref:Asl1-like glycosyl hydrolase catalytic domain-containing protein n=1 Tax=Couchioplanes caeruleus subsp. caeruleus TaxID=56427 RepID=A0A1K0FEE7_9ACTN|nr:hypothetical protein BG844_28660 [Couchioplanes caeruleus subsp. caeruleus]